MQSSIGPYKFLTLKKQKKIHRIVLNDRKMSAVGWYRKMNEGMRIKKQSASFNVGVIFAYSCKTC